MTHYHIIFVCDDQADPGERADRIARSIDAFSTRADNLCIDADKHHCLSIECDSEEDARVCERALLSHLDDCCYDRDDSEHVTGFHLA